MTAAEEEHWALAVLAALTDAEHDAEACGDCDGPCDCVRSERGEEGGDRG